MKRCLLIATATSALTALISLSPAHAQVTGVTPPSASAPTTVVVHGDKPRRPHTWFKAESQHFIVYSNTQHKDVAGLLAKMERFWFTLREFTQVDLNPPADAPKMELYYLGDEHDLHAVDPEDPPYAIGLYSGCEDGSQGFGVHMYYQERAQTALEKQPENEGLVYIFQAYARHFFYSHSSQRTPQWFIDGFSQYFSATRFDGNTAVVGMAPAATGTLLQRLGSEYLYSLDYSDILIGNDSDGHSDVGPAGIKNEFQARSWVLTHWILSSHENLARFQAYITAIHGGEDKVKAFQRVFGLTPGQLNHTLWLYLRKLQAVKMTFKSLPEADITFTDLPEAADAVLIDQAALKSCPGTKYGQTLLNDLRTKAPKFESSELAQSSLARAEIEFGDPQKALPWLEKAVQENSHDAEAQYLLGRAHLAIGAKLTGDGQAQAYTTAATAFEKAANEDPKSPVTAYWFYRSQVLATGKIDVDSAGAAVLAYQEAQDVDAYAYHAALAYGHLGRRDEALAALHAVADNPHPSAWAPLAKKWIAKLDGGAWDADIITAMKADDPQPAKGAYVGQADWTIAAADVLTDLDAAVSAQAAQDAGLVGVDGQTDSAPN